MTTNGDSRECTRHAIVSAAWGRRVEIELDDLHRHQARPRGKRMRLVCGDRVEVRPVGDEADWLIERQLERRSELARVDGKGRREVLAANVDSLYVVVAPEPPPDLFVVDRFLGAAEQMRCSASIVLNKSDLGSEVRELFSVYVNLGYPVLATSARSGSGIEDLVASIATQSAVLVGQSGVGKSSLLNAIVPDAGLRTGKLIRSGKTGRHTTVAAQLFRLENGGGLIDSPGVRDFAPFIASSREVALAYREISSTAERCRFADCLHRAEPDCAVKTAAESGDIDPRRYTSYRRLLNLTLQLRSRDGQIRPGGESS